MRRSITAVANALLRDSRVKSPPVPAFEIARGAGAIVRVGPLPVDLSGFLLFRAQHPVIGVNNIHSATRQRFTVAHELGHLVLHPSKSYVDHGFPIFFRDSRSSRAQHRDEIEANQFAADLLMPRAMLTAFLQGAAIDIDDVEELERLARGFDVSPQAMTFRLINLGITSQAASRRA